MATQTTYPLRATLRTLVQGAIALCAAGPLIWQAATESSPEAATGAIGVGLGIMAAVTRIMAIPQVNAALGRIGLSAAPPSAPDEPIVSDESAAVDPVPDALGFAALPVSMPPPKRDLRKVAGAVALALLALAVIRWL